MGRGGAPSRASLPGPPAAPATSLAEHIEALCAHLYRSYGVDPERIALELHIADVTLDLGRSIRAG